MSESAPAATFFAARHYFVLVLIVLLFSGLIARSTYLQVFNQDFLLDEGSQRQLRTIETPAYRGSIMDRFGTPLAISTPVDSVWVNPKQALIDVQGLKQVTKSLGLNFAETLENLRKRADKEFVYLKRQIKPELARKAAEGVEGVYLQREYHRFYPAGEVVSHVLGFTDIDNMGREGLELIYQDWLKAWPGRSP